MQWRSLSSLAMMILCINNLANTAQPALPEGFGATHFIVGVPASQKQQSTHNQQPNLTQSSVAQILFSPDDDVSAQLINLINQEKHSIKVAIFLLTDETIVQALLNAHQRGVLVELLVDPKHMYDRSSRVEQLCKHGMCVFVFNPKYADPAGFGLMHNKFVIFGSHEKPDSCVWTGSFNFTRAAGTYNQEHVVVVQGAAAVKRFGEQFECLKQRCTRYSTRLAS